MLTSRCSATRSLGFEALSLQQKLYIYCLSEATLYGRDITFDQFGRYNLVIRKTLEAVLRHYEGDRTTKDFLGFETYLKQVWFASGIHHHYGCEKFVPTFSEDFLRHEVLAIDPEALPLSTRADDRRTARRDLPRTLRPAGAAEARQHRRRRGLGADIGVQLLSGGDATGGGGLLCPVARRRGRASLMGTQHHARQTGRATPGGGLENRRKIFRGHRKDCLLAGESPGYAEGEGQRRVIDLLIHYYQTGDLRDFDRYSIAWVDNHEGSIDFINGFIEVYGDPLGLKGSWEGIVEYRDEEATRRTRAIADRAQWFEDHSPVDPRFRKPKVKGVSANAVCAAMLGGDEYPASAIGINLPNADWIRAQHGSKSVTITNLTHAYDEAARGNGFREEFIP